MSISFDRNYEPDPAGIFEIGSVCIVGAIGCGALTSVIWINEHPEYFENHSTAKKLVQVALMAIGGIGAGALVGTGYALQNTVLGLRPAISLGLIYAVHNYFGDWLRRTSS